MLRQRAARRTCPRQTPETLLSMLGHHQMDTHTAGQNGEGKMLGRAGVPTVQLLVLDSSLEGWFPS